MKKKITVIVSICAIVLICVLSVFMVFSSRNIKPLETLDTENIWQIIVFKISDGVKYEVPKISGGDEFSALLKELSVEKEIENSNTFLNKIAEVDITVRKADPVSLKLYNNRIIINSVMYQADEAALKPIIDFIENINSESAYAIFESPPGLKILSGVKSIEAGQGNSSWSYGNTSTMACGSHPLMWGDNINRLKTDTNEAELIFAAKPSNFSVVCYSAEYIGLQPNDLITEEVETDGTSITLKSGAYIYEVNASFSGSDWGGSCSYGFYAESP